MEEDGVLTAKMVVCHVSRSGCFGIALQHVHQSLSLPRYNLSDISVLCSYVHLQKLELPHNKIRDLSCVSHMPYLVILDASDNEISNYFEFQPPKKLQEVNFSHNRLTKMKNLSDYVYLCKMDLDHNSFSEITGLEHCCRLTHLSLAHNKISRVSGLDGLPLTHLCLRENQLERTEGLANLKSLQVLDLSLNRITSISGLQNLHQLVSINLEKNKITEVQECKHLHDFLLLRDLNLMGNPVQEQLGYRLAVVFLLQHLTILDQEKVTAEEKVSSVNKYDPPMEVVAARDHMTHLVYQLMQPQVLYESTPPNADTSYPLLVLTGPRGCGKRELVHRLCQEFSEFFGYGISYTTRAPYFGEENGIDYHFVSEVDFQNMIHMGKFIQTMQFGGHQFGLSKDAIEDLAKVGLACCIHMELEGVLSLKKSYFEPQYVLLIPTQVQTYKDHLKNRGIYTPAQIDAAVSRVDLYNTINTQRPGFFDKVIACDDWEEAFLTLQQIVKEYLLPEGEDEGQNNSRASFDKEKPHSLLSGSRSEAFGPRSASALDCPSSSYRPCFTKIQGESSPEKTPAEAASIRRREQLVREALAGRSPGVYSQHFKWSPEAAQSFPNNKEPVDAGHEDSSSDESRTSSVLSVPSSAGALLEPLDLSVLGHALDPLKDNVVSSRTPESPLPGIDRFAVAVSPSSDRCPGSSIKTILPPIPTGHKTPAAPSLMHSPRLSPVPAAGRGSANMEGYITEPKK